MIFFLKLKLISKMLKQKQVENNTTRERSNMIISAVMMSVSNEIIALFFLLLKKLIQLNGRSINKKEAARFLLPENGMSYK